jgi:hypothetical protein
MLAGRSIWPALDTGEEPVYGRLPTAGAGHGGQWHELAQSPNAGEETSRKERWGLDRGSFRPVDPAAGNRLDVSAWGDRRDRRGLSRLLGLPIQSPDPLGQEAAFAEAVLSSGAEVVLICYEHRGIPALVRGIPGVDGGAIPAVWPGDRFDVIWTFTLDRDGGRYVFGQVPQQLLGGDTDTVI